VTGSSSAGDARPVLRPANSLFSVATAPFIRRFISSLLYASAIFLASTAPVLMLTQTGPRAFLFFLDDRRPPLAPQHPGQGAAVMQRKDQNRNTVLSRQRNCRRIHYCKISR